MPGASPRADRLLLRSRRRLLMAGVGVAVYGLIAPLLAITHEVIVLAVAHLVGDAATLLSRSGALRTLPLDPIYTGAMVLTLGGIQPRGLALAGQVGEALHAALPLLFESPSLVSPRAWASAIVDPGATIVSRWLCSIVADAALLALGLVLVRRAIRGQWRGWLAVVGAIIQAHVVVTHLVDVPPELIEVEAAGVPFAIAMLMSGDVLAGPRLAESLASLHETQRDILLGLGMVALAYVPVLAGLLLWKVVGGLRRLDWRAPWRLSMLSRRLPMPPLPHARVLRDGLIGAGGFAPALGRLVVTGLFALAVALSPVGDLADAQTHFLAASMDDTGLPEAGPVDPNGSRARSTSRAAPSPTTVADAPSVVAVTGSGYRFQYVVNGTPRIIRGIGYNVQYRSLPPNERLRRLDRDFARLHEAGVNTVFGWDPAEFDRALLDSAHRHGLGVSPPFDLDPDADYADPEVRARVTSEALAWVAAYKDHPALRMWSIGNEVLHKLVYPSWMPLKSDPAWEQRARDFAAFYVELVDKVRAADPNHPIVHRDAEDAYLTWLRDEMLKSERRPWFVYGVNTYTPRLSEILSQWPDQGWDVPLLVSEFAPGGMSPADRPQGFREMWKTIRSANGWVLGGAVYAWTTDGPEEVDRVFGLVDEHGAPVDGAFSVIGAFYRGVARQAETEPTRPDEPRDERVWAYSRAAIKAIMAGYAVDLLPDDADTSIMGDLNNLPLLGVADADLTVERVRDPRRVAWAREGGIVGEWWVTWRVPDRPNQKLTFVVNERDGGTLSVRYIYHGPR